MLIYRLRLRCVHAGMDAGFGLGYLTNLEDLLEITQIVTDSLANIHLQELAESGRRAVGRVVHLHAHKRSAVTGRALETH